MAEGVESWIEQYRAGNSLQDDADFASALLSQSLNIGTFRQNDRRILKRILRRNRE